MTAEEQHSQQESKGDEEPWIEESGQEWQEGQEEEQVEQEPTEEETTTVKENKDLRWENGRVGNDRNSGRSNEGEKGVFLNGLSVGLGIGCIGTFVTMWIVVFFTPQLPPGATYQTMLSIFIYPLIYLLAIGLIALTAGIVREYYIPESRS